MGSKNFYNQNFDKKGLIRKMDHLTAAPRMQGKVKNAKMYSKGKKGK